MEPERVVDRIDRWLHVPAVVGFEEPLLATIAGELAASGRRSRRVAGMVVSPGTDGGWISTHSDRHGLVTKGHGVLGYAAKHEAGAHRPLSRSLGRRVCDRFVGEAVYAYDPGTGERLAEGGVDHGSHCGVGPDISIEAPGLAELEPGLPVAFAGGARIADSLVSGQLDNVASVAIAFELLAAGFGGTVLFTVGEEAGRSWRGLADYFGDRELGELLVLDTSPFDDPEPCGSGRVVLRRADAGGAFDAGFVERIAGAAARAGAPIIWKDALLAGEGRPLGRTELGRLSAATEGRLNGATLQLPTTDYHSNHETTSIGAISNVLRTLGRLFDL